MSQNIQLKRKLYYLFDRLIPHLYRKHDAPPKMVGAVLNKIEKENVPLSRALLINIVEKELYNSRRDGHGHANREFLSYLNGLINDIFPDL